MDRLDIELLQSGLLLQLQRAQPNALRVRTLHTNSKLISGMPQLDESTVKERLNYLENKGMIERKAKTLCPENVEYVITEKGVIHLDENGLT